MEKQYEIVQVEQNTPEWLAMRLGMLTGSKAKGAVGNEKAQKTLIYELIGEQLTGVQEEFFKSYAIEWGNMNEPYAIDEYEHRTGIKTDAIGFCVSTKYPWMGLSPDRLAISDDAEVTHAVVRPNDMNELDFEHSIEVKCPNTTTMIRYIDEGGIPDDYLAQVIHYFIVINTLQTLDFVVYDPRIQSKKHQLYRVRVTREDLLAKILEHEQKYLMFRALWDDIEYKVMNIKETK